MIGERRDVSLRYPWGKGLEYRFAFAVIAIKQKRSLCIGFLLLLI